MADLLNRLQHVLSENYAVVRELGRGGMAVVMLAHDLKHQRQVAIKVLRPELGQSLGSERFLREIQIAARLAHPNILPVFDSGAADGLLYYVMPYVEGETLRARLQREGQFPLAQALRLTQHVAHALDYAHGQGIVHRDIKPENILLESGDAVVADYGLALAISVAGGERLTETGLALGTPAYMSPEQAAGEHHLDGRSDQYSLGCVLYEMLAGEPPFTGPTAQAIMAKRFANAVPSIRVLRESVPPAVDRAISRALAKVPADRFTTAGEFAQALTQPEATATARRSLVALRRWGPAVGLAALAAAGFLLSRSRPARLTDANLLAIAPFDVLDPSLQIWREGFVDILSRDLDGAGPLRTVSQSVGLRRWRGRADPASAAAFGKRIGAGLVVFGSVRQVRGTVTLRATVMDVIRNRAEPDLEIKGDTAAMGDLADSLGVRILQVLGRSRPIGAVRQVSIGSRSLPALKAFLFGEQFYRRGLWDSALVYYQHAIEQDSSFVLAYRRMALVLSWNVPTSGEYRPMDDYIARYVTLNHGLSLKDSLVVAADSYWMVAEHATIPAAADLIRYRYRALSVLEEAARRYPADPEVWLSLGETRNHSPPPLGAQPASALAAFNRVISLDPGFAPAYEHTVRLAMLLNRPDLARRYAEAYLSLDPSDVNAPSIRLAALMLDSARSHAPETARLIDTASSLVLFRAGLEHLGPWADSGEAAIRIMRELAQRSGTGADPWSDTLMYHQYLAVLLAYRGHLKEAYAVDRRLLLDLDASPFSAFGDVFLDLALLAAIPESLAAAHFGHALRSSKAWAEAGFFGTPRPLAGLPWWLARKDSASLSRFAVRAGAEAQRQREPTARLRARYLHAAATAYLALVRADSSQALRLFQAIPDTLCIVTDCYYQKLTEARVLEALGRTPEAQAVLDRWIWSAAGDQYVLGVLELGRIAESMGQREKANQSYQFVVNVWRRADPELQPYVLEARNALARLTRE
ncbi:MAG: protein kinase domain-containing protein [Gemmatimonadales bacterium]